MGEKYDGLRCCWNAYRRILYPNNRILCQLSNWLQKDILEKEERLLYHLGLLSTIREESSLMVSCGTFFLLLFPSAFFIGFFILIFSSSSRSPPHTYS